MRRTGLLAAGLLLAACVGSQAFAARAHAQGAQPDDAELQRGLTALREGRDADAVQAFESSYAATPRPLTLLNLGIAYTHLGEIALALKALEGYAETADRLADARNLEAVRREIARLRALQVATPPASPAAPPPTAASNTTAAATHAQPQLAEAAAPAASTDATTEKPEAAASDETDGPCSLGTTCLGPVLALGLPNLIGGGVQLRFGDYFGAGLSLQLLPTVPILDLGSLRATLFSVEGRIYPFGGSFFLAAGFAYQAATATAETDDISAEASASLPAFVAGIGFFGREGGVLGIDVGLMVPVASASVSVRTLSEPPMGVDAADVAEAQANARSGAQDFIDLLPVLVQLNLVRLGYLF